MMIWLMTLTAAFACSWEFDESFVTNPANAGQVAPPLAPEIGEITTTRGDPFNQEDSCFDLGWLVVDLQQPAAETHTGPFGYQVELVGGAFPDDQPVLPLPDRSTPYLWPSQGFTAVWSDNQEQSLLPLDVTFRVTAWDADGNSSDPVTFTVTDPGRTPTAEDMAGPDDPADSIEPQDTDGSSGCSTTGGPGGLWWLLPLTALGRRRQSRHSPGCSS